MTRFVVTGTNFERFLPDTTRICSETVIATLVKMLKAQKPISLICPELIANLVRCSGAIYLAQKSAHDDDREWGSRRSHIWKIGQLARQLHEALSMLDDPASDLFWAPQERLAIETILSRDGTGSFGQKLRSVPVGEARMLLYLETPQFCETLETLQKYATHAAGKISIRPGRPSDFILQNWVGNMASIWGKHTNQRFSYQPHRGGGLTPAFDFCEAALRPLAVC